MYCIPSVNSKDSRHMFEDTDTSRNVRKIINKKAWNIATSEKIDHTWGYTEPTEVFGSLYYDDAQTLFRTRMGRKYFIVRYDKLEFVGGEEHHEFIDTITPLSDDQAKEWITKYSTIEIYESCFDLPDAGDGETAISLRTTDRHAKALRILAKIRNQSVNALINSVIVDAIRDNVTEIMAYAKKQKLKTEVAEGFNKGTK